MNNFILTTQDSPAEYKITETLGLVRGNTVRSPNFVKNFLAGIRAFLGGEIPELNEALNDSRDQAINRLITHAKEINANGITGLRIVTSDIGTYIEILAYGTAVKLEKI